VLHHDDAVYKRKGRNAFPYENKGRTCAVLSERGDIETLY
jgi:hypothetical protein